MDTTPRAQPIATAAPPDRVRIVATPGTRKGRPRIDGHRVTVADVAVWHQRQGLSPDEIVDRYPSLTLSDVHAALAYYFENQERIDEDVLEDERLAERFLAGRPSILEKARRRAAGGKDDSLPPG